ncbi:MAG TPA: bifunctional homocysteine S-methyltransferase/methylenetetrahydrofolate reductase [Limnochordia bacterium]|nr:bifunctional homocysteine S-methyltransferase/methylenetetrahydrofolate reductase [Limnochordia bacterium]
MAERGFLQRLADGPLLVDGAMGTWLNARGVRPEACFEVLNTEDRRLVHDAHLAYIQAGADVIMTNTFGANRLRLALHGLSGKAWDLNLWGVKTARAAREVGGREVWVAGSIGPTGAALQPLGELTAESAFDVFREQAEALLAGGVDLFIVETMSDPVEAAAAVRAIRSLCRLPVVLNFSFSDETRTFTGQSPAAIVSGLRLELAGELPEVLGVNCATGPVHALAALEQLRDAAGPAANLCLMPNAGLPARVAGRLLYNSSPEYFGEFTPRMLAAGARLVGGCCGTTPAHTRAMRQALDGDSGAAEIRVLAAPAVAPPPPAAKARDGAKTEGLAAKLGREFAVSVELDPPKGTVLTRFLANAKVLHEAGVDAVNIADSPMARVRLGCVAAAHLVQEQVGLETIIHFTTRDRNLMGLQSELMGAAALGIRNVLALTGDPPNLGGTRASGVYDVDSIGLIHILQGLNRGQDIGNNPIGEPTDFTIACALSPNADDLSLEIERFQKKLAAGVDFVMTQPLYELEPLRRVLERIGAFGAPVLLGVMPLHSFKHAEYLHNEVPGISIPAAVRAQLQQAGDDGLEVGMEQARTLIAQAAPYIDGVYIVPSFGKIEPVAELVRRLKNDPATAGQGRMQHQVTQGGK